MLSPTRNEGDGLAGDPHGLGALRDEMHLDAPEIGLVAGAVREGGEVEVGAERFARTSRLRLKAAVMPARSS